MTVENLVSKLDTLGVPVAYYSFPVGEAPSLPWLVYYFPESADVYADGVNYQNINVVYIELYTEHKDFDLEARVDELLKNNGISFRKTESYIDSERMFEILYTMEVLING